MSARSGAKGVLRMGMKMMVGESIGVFLKASSAVELVPAVTVNGKVTEDEFHRL